MAKKKSDAALTKKRVEKFCRGVSKLAMKYFLRIETTHIHGILILDDTEVSVARVNSIGPGFVSNLEMLPSLPKEGKGAK